MPAARNVGGKEVFSMPYVQTPVAGDERADTASLMPRPQLKRSAPPTARRPGSSLGALVMSGLLIALGVLMLLDLAGLPVAASFYFSVPLVIVGAGLVVGAWHGRARPLIAVGVVLSAGLAITVSIENWNPSAASRSVTWRPAAAEQMDNSYEINIGNATLDLSAVDFTRTTTSVDARVSVGNLDIIVPANVDVTVQASVDVGTASVFDERWSGLGQPERTVSDQGSDGAGGGQLRITATVDVGDLEVRR
jgi:hypothetical protein